MSRFRHGNSSLWGTDAGEREMTPVAKPRLPTSAQIATYLERIDMTRWYSNGGPLIREFEGRLAQHYGGDSVRVATVANATIGLTVALLASNLREGSLCMVPSWTFAATGQAILLAGLVPWIVDVSGETWALEPNRAREFLGVAPGEVAAVIPVSPFGAPIDLEPWQKFRDETGIAVIADAAASFDSIRPGAIPAVVSLHATKICGVGEGGFVISTCEFEIEEIQKRTNFGFWNSRESTVRSLNGKLSEYAAAVGLASLDAWSETRADFLRVGAAYRGSLTGQEHLRLQPGFGESWVSSTVLIESKTSDAVSLIDVLTQNRIGSRRWWGGGLHQHRIFREFPRHCVKQTEAVAERVVGLPCWRDLPDEEIARICKILRTA